MPLSPTPPKATFLHKGVQHHVVEADTTRVGVLENEFFLYRRATDEIHGERTCKFAQFLRRPRQRVVGDDRQHRPKDLFLHDPGIEWRIVSSVAQRHFVYLSCVERFS